MYIFTNWRSTLVIILNSTRRLWLHLNQIINESSESDFDRLIKLIDKSINKLPKKCKEIFKLSKTDGLTNNEIATLLNISAKTVEAQITIAFKKIKADVVWLVVTAI